MKCTKILILAALAGCVLSLAASAFAQSTHPGVVTVVRVSGEANYSLGDGKWYPLVAGKLLAQGSVIKTGPEASVDLVLGKTISMPQAKSVPDRISQAPDSPVRGWISYKPSVEQNTVRLVGDTVLAIDKLSVSDTGVDSVSDTELDLRQGAIYNSVKKLSGASQYLIKIPNGIAGVRGTQFYIRDNAECAALKNSLVLSYFPKMAAASGTAAPRTVVVGEGNRFDPQTGQVTPLSSDVINQLSQIFTSLRTTFLESVNFTFDFTKNCMSSTTGKNEPPPPPHPPVGGGY